MTVDVGVGVSVDDNDGLDDPSLGTTSEAFTALNFNLRNQTTSDTLVFGLGTRLVFSDSPEDGTQTEFLPPVASLGYSRFNRNSRLEFSASYSKRPVEDTVLTFFDADLNPVDFVIDSGNLTLTNFGVRYETGLEGPLKFSGGIRVSDRDYSDTIDLDLYDRSTVTTDAEVQFTFSPVATGRVFARQSVFEADDALSTERTTTTFGVGASYAASPVLDLDASVSLTQIEEVELGLPEKEDGIGFSLSGTRDLPNGELRAGIQRRLSTSAQRTLISLNRTVELPAGELTYGIGYSIAEEGDNVLLASFGMSRDFADGRIGVSLSQSTRSNDDDEDILLTRFAVDFSRDINAVSGYSVGFGLGQSEEIGSGSGETTTRADLSLSYRRELTSEWDWSLGYRGRYLEDGDTARSNEIFTRIDRSFSIRP